jgi:hemoglobin/transferrin/lactoferrin receptor protein
MPLIGVTVEAIDVDFSMISDINGEVLIPEDLSDNSFRCQYLGYSERVIIPKNQQTGTIVMTSDDELLSTVEIVGRAYERQDLQPQRIEVISSKEIASLQANTSADVMMQSGDVYVQKSQSGGGSPILRGFEANKVLLVVDGVRMNNLIYRSGHLQNAITVDHSALEQMELIFGPGSLTYGSDALGGVIHFKTLDPKFNTEQNVGINLQFTSANLGARLNAIHKYGSDKFASATSISVSRFDDLRSGQNRSSQYDDFPEFGLSRLYFDSDGNLRENLNPHILRITGYSQYDIIQKFKFRLGNHSELILNGQLSTSSDIPRYDQLSLVDNAGIPIFRKWSYGPQSRLLLSPTFTYNKKNRLFDKLVAIASYQDVEESRIVQSRESAFVSTQLEKVKVLGLTVDFNKVFGDHFFLQYGADFHYNWLNSSVTNLDDFGNSEPALTRYPDGDNTLSQVGLYAKGTLLCLDDKARLTGGIRYSQQQVFMQYDSDEVFVWPDFFFEGITNNTNALIGSLSLLYDFDIIKARVSTATGFRAPNTDDLAKIRIKTDEITVPNPELTPEKTFNIEGSLHFDEGKTKVDVYGYATWIDDIILRANGTLPDGSVNYVAPDGLVYAVTANINGASGLISGMSLSLNQSIATNLTFDGKLNLINGTSTLDGEDSPLGHIPPLFGSAGLTYTYGNYVFTGNTLFNGNKPISEYGGSVDNPEYALPSGTPAWAILNLRLTRETEKARVSLSVENLLDSFYRPFASGVNGSGRSINVSIGYQF